MAHDPSDNGTMSSTLVSLLTGMHQTLGELRQGQRSNRDLMLAELGAIHRRIDDVKTDLLDRIATARTGRRATDWGRLPWRLIFKACGLLLGGLLVLMGHLSVSELKSLFGLPPLR